MMSTATAVAPAEAHSWDRGSWMQTYTGIAFYPLAPTPEDINPMDIAHGISMQCRYNGHVSRFYSVAEHCVLMADYLSEIGARREIALWGLLHDATESYVGDMVRPLKKHMPAFSLAEDVVMGAIIERFGLQEFPTMPETVRNADNSILLDERKELLKPPPQAWSVEDLKPLGIQIHGWDPFVAKEMYLNRLEELTGEKVPR